MPMSEYMRRLRSLVGTTLLELPTVTVVHFDDAGRILLVRHSEGNVWTTPGGAVEPGESPANAAVREMWEETGLWVELTRVIGVYGGPEFQTTYSNGDAISFLMTVFEARLLAGDPRPDEEETLEVGYFSRQELDGLQLAHWLPRVLPDLFGDRGLAHFDAATWRPVL